MNSSTTTIASADGSDRKKRTSLPPKTTANVKPGTPLPQAMQPRVLTLHSEDVQATEGLIGHFTQPKLLPKMPWEMEYEERRLNSKDPRIQKQVLDSKQWEETCMAGIWERLLCFTSPVLDWNMTQDDFRNWLSFEGIRSTFLKEKLVQIFDPPQSDLGTKGAAPSMKKCYNALKVCNILETALTMFPYQDLFVQHCFERFDRPSGTDRLSVDLILSTQLKEVPQPVPPLPGPGMGRVAVVGAFTDETNPFKASKKRGGAKKKKRKSVVNLKANMAAGAGYLMVEAFKQVIEAGDFDKMREDRSQVEAMRNLSLAKLHHHANNSNNNAPTTNQNGMSPTGKASSPLVPSSVTLGRLTSSTPESPSRDQQLFPAIHSTATPPSMKPSFDPHRPGSPPSPKPIRQIIPSLLAAPRREYNNDGPINDDEITYNMFKAAFLDPKNARIFTAYFVLPLLEAAAKYFSAPHGELPLVSMRWERSMVPIPSMNYTEIIEATVGAAGSSNDRRTSSSPLNRGANQQHQRKRSTANNVSTMSTVATPPLQQPSSPSPVSFQLTPHPPSTPTTTDLNLRSDDPQATAASTPPVEQKGRYCPYDADSVLFKECEHLGGVDPWRVPPKKKKKGASKK